MTFKELNKKYIDGQITKAEYIDEVYNHIHSPLFELSGRLPDTAIESIEISGGGVYMTFKNSGLKFRLAEGDKRLAPLDAINFADYEKSEMEIQFSLIREGQTIYDIGANFGWYSLHLAHHFQGKLNIHAFEPVPSTFSLCQENLQLNHQNGITLHPHGFSNESGEMNIYFSPSLSVNASLKPLSKEEDTVPVRCRFKTLDEVAGKELPAPDFIKCDVEGAEWLVFKGGSEFFKNNRPVVFAEMLRKWAAKFDYHPNDMIQWFASYGYQCFGVSARGLLLISEVNDTTTETNYVFLHPEAHSHFLKHGKS